MRKIKNYEEVKVGDLAYENPDAGGQWENQLGIITAIGNYHELGGDEEEEGIEDFDPSEYVWVVVNLEIYGPTLFNYNCDPSGCVVFKE